MRQHGKNNPKQKNGTGLRSILRGRGGFTLIELIVTFALISIFAVASCQVIASAIGAYHRIRGLDYALQVSDTLMEKITGEFEGALTAPLDDRNGKTAAVLLSGSGDSGNKTSAAELRDRTGSHICITTKAKQLLIYYYPVENGTGNQYDAVDWTFDQAVYMGFHVESLTFEQALKTEGTAYTGDILKVSLKIKSDKYGAFTSERYVRCYNFVDEVTQGKIETG